MLFSSRQKQVEQRIEEYCQDVTQCLDAFRDSLRAFTKQGDRGALQSQTQEVHRWESKADDTRREIELLMYKRAVFPESRGDILGLLEATDDVPDIAESACRMVVNQHVELPAEMAEDMARLIDLNHDTAMVTVDTVRKLFANYARVTEDLGRIDEMESEVDDLEARLVEQAVTSDLPGVGPIILRDWVQMISDISDHCLEVADRLSIIVAKRGS